MRQARRTRTPIEVRRFGGSRALGEQGYWLRDRDNGVSRRTLDVVEVIEYLETVGRDADAVVLDGLTGGRDLALRDLYERYRGGDAALPRDG